MNDCAIATTTGGDESSDKPPSCRVHDAEEPPGKPFENVPADQWNDWRWQMRNRIRSLQQLKKVYPCARVTSGMADAMRTFPMAVTPYYAGLIRSLSDSDPVFRMCVPDAAELFNPSFLENDPLGEDGHMPVPGLVHRYGDRALLISTSTCASYCRHCTRKRVAGQVEGVISSCQLDAVAGYLRSHPEIKDVVVSGGDPLTLATPVLEGILKVLRSVPSVEVIRIGTRVPVVMPMRVDGELTEMLRKYHPVFVNTHFNHPNELTQASLEACGRLADAGIPLGNQTVLLRGINDDAKTLEALFRGLLRGRVRPYYLFQCDLVKGVEHFRTRLSKGVNIMEQLRGRLSGLAIPLFVVDAPHGGGKIPVMPEYVVTSTGAETVLRNYQGLIVAYPEPCDAVAPSDTVPGRRRHVRRSVRQPIRAPAAKMGEVPTLEAMLAE
jgi:lysine 2,3-aminomutase